MLASSDLLADSLFRHIQGESPELGAEHGGNVRLQRLMLAEGAFKQASEKASSQPYADWMNSLGLVIDRRHPFTYTGYEFLRPVYDAIPYDLEALPDLAITIQKAAQCGATIWAIGVPLYLSLRIKGFSTTYYLPDQATANKISGERFLELVRPNAELYQILQNSNRGTQRNEGAKHLRRFGSGFIFFGYLGGGMQTESMPLDLLEYDEVQLMTPTQMEKARERVAASKWKIQFRLSTALMPDSDINHYFKQSDQRYWHTRCHCGSDPMSWVVLSEIWPNCIGESGGKSSNVGLGRPSGVFYRCPRCDTLIRNPRNGRYVPHAPENSPHYGFHFAQTLLPTLTAAQLFEKFRDSRDLQNFHNRCLGRPYSAEDKVPVSVELLKRKVYSERCQWVTPDSAQRVRGGMMGIDHMGGFNVVTILARVGEKYRFVWVEVHESDDPFERMDYLMERYGVEICTIENTPNYNDARRFAKRHYGKVWIVNYQQLAGEMFLWKDKASMNASQRRTDPEQELPYLVGVDQFRLMSYTLGMFRAGLIEIPHPEKFPLMQHVSVPPFVTNRLKAGQVNVALASALHFTRIALITQEVTDPLSGKKQAPFVHKVGIDPHFAYSGMLAVLSTIRAYGVSRILDIGDTLTDVVNQSEADMARAESSNPQQQQVNNLLDRLSANALPPGRCASCQYLGPERGQGWNLCTARRQQVRPADAACIAYAARAATNATPLGDLTERPVSVKDLLDDEFS